MRLAEQAIDPFQLLVSARRRELEGWCEVAAYLCAFKQHGVQWWAGIADNEREALDSPELQLPHTTAQQYRELWEVFGHMDPDRLAMVRPRLLYQTIRAVRRGEVEPEDAVADALAQPWGQLRYKYDKPDGW